MKEQPSRTDMHSWEHLPPDKALAVIVYELYNPVSLLSSQINRLTDDDDPLTEDEYEAIFEQMKLAVRQLSKTIVGLKRYTQDIHPEMSPPPPIEPPH